MVIKNVKIYTMTKGIISNGYIRIDRDKIVEVGSMATYQGTDKELNLEGYTVYPGFIEAHSHLGLVPDGLSYMEADFNEVTEPVTPELRVIDAVNPMDRSFKEALLAGVTTVAVSPGSSNPIAGQVAIIKTLGNRIDDMIVRAPAAIKFALGENPKLSGSKRGRAPNSRMAISAIIREALIKTQRYEKAKRLRKEEPYKNITSEIDIKAEAMLGLIRGDIPAHIHAHRADDVFTAIRIATEFNLKYAIVHGTEAYKIMEDLEKEDINIFSGPILSDRSKAELKSLTERAPEVLSKAGVPVCIITDHPETPEKFLSLCAAVAVREGMDELKALEAITVNPAKALNIFDRVGSIEVGKDADLVICKGNPLDIRVKPEIVICNGRLMKDA